MIFSAIDQMYSTPYEDAHYQTETYNIKLKVNKFEIYGQYQFQPIYQSLSESI